jgi:hypothetical protein
VGVKFFLAGWMVGCKGLDLVYSIFKVLARRVGVSWCPNISMHVLVFLSPKRRKAGVLIPAENVKGVR